MIRRFIIPAAVLLIALAAHAAPIWDTVSLAELYPGASELAAGDLDGDGDTDLVASGERAGEITLDVWRNVNGSFQRIVLTAAAAEELLLADLDGDGVLEIVARTGPIVAFRYEQGGSWSVHPISLLNWDDASLEAVDVDEDGDLDLIVGRNSTLYWLENQGANWDPHVLAADEVDAPIRTFTRDFDNNGSREILVVGYWGTVHQLRLDGLGEWVAELISDNLFRCQEAALGDLDGDGDDDLVVISSSDLVVFYHSGGDWLPTVVHDQPFGGESVAVMQVDEDDAALELVVGGGRRTVWYDEAGGLWDQAGEVGLSGGQQLHVGFADGNARADVFASDPLRGDLTLYRRARVTVQIDPNNSPVVVPGGGLFLYDLALACDLQQPGMGVVWTHLRLPNGNLYGPLNTAPFYFSRDLVIEVTDLAQYIPEAAPLGVYQFFLSAGPAVNTPIAMDSLQFVVIQGDAPASGNGEWSSPQFASRVTGDRPGGADGGASGSSAAGQLSTPTIDVLPNPFNALASVTMSLPAAVEVELAVFDLLGRQTARIHQGPLSAGEHRFSVNSSRWASGLYLLRARVGAKLITRKLVVLK